MWFRNFFLNSVDAFFNALPTAVGGGYEGDTAPLSILGIPLLWIFILGCIIILFFFV